MEREDRVAVRGIKVMDITTERHRAKNVTGRPFYALSYRFAGEVTVETNGIRFVSAPDSITFTPKGVSYRTAVKERSQMIVVHFDLVRDVDFRSPAVIPNAGGELRTLFERLAAMYSVNAPNDFTCMSIFYQILALLERRGDTERRVPPCVEKAKRQIDASFTNADLSIARLAEAVGVSDSYLRRAFRESLGESPLEYLTRVRIRHAKNMLESEYFTVAEIAAGSGFHSAGYFIQSFRTQTGETPNGYRKRKGIK